MADNSKPWQPLADILATKVQPTPGLKEKQERLLQQLTSGSTSAPPTQPEMTPEQELEDGKFRRAQVLQQLAASKGRKPGSPE